MADATKKDGQAGKTGKKDSKNIILCCDGTGNEYRTHNTNVVHAYQLATKNNRQLAYYDPGVGTGGWDYTRSLRQTGWDAITGGGLQKNVEDGYRFLMKTYEKNDRVFLFGFSRGAFTVRSLAGMLARCGLLHPNLDNLVEYASKLYNEKGNKLKTKFKNTFARDCPVYFIGVWDTVGALAFGAKDKFHDYTLNPKVKYAYHAIALDEKRKKFDPCLWDNKRNAPGQTIEQVWFAGSHSNIGGGYINRDLSDIALRWMLGKAARCGMRIKRKAVSKGKPLGQQHESHKGIKWRMQGTLLRKVPPNSKVHRSVQTRILGGGYEPIARLSKNAAWKQVAPKNAVQKSVKWVI